MIRNALLGSLALVGVCLSASTLNADDTVRLLGGAGSLSAAVTADTRTLEGGNADTVPVCCWRRYCRWACCAPVCPPVVCTAPAYYSAPAYYPAPMTAPPPAAGPATYYSPPPAEAVTIIPGRPQITVGYQGRFFNGSVAIPLGARIARFARPVDEPIEAAPPPRRSGNYRYDGGPSQAVPMPSPDPINATDPVPTTVPALHRVMWERSRTKVTYPAYGEPPAAKAATSPPLLVKRADNR